MLLVGDLV